MAKRALLVIGVWSAAALGRCILAVPVAFMGTSAHAQNYPWCSQYSGDMGGAMNCGFVSFQQCMENVWGIGGFCVRNDWYHPPAGPHSSAAPRR